jgi:hypothetical protein
MYRFPSVPATCTGKVYRYDSVPGFFKPIDTFHSRTALSHTPISDLSKHICNSLCEIVLPGEVDIDIYRRRARRTSKTSKHSRRYIWWDAPSVRMRVRGRRGLWEWWGAVSRRFGLAVGGHRVIRINLDEPDRNPPPI